MTEYKVHRIRFVEYSPKPINSVAFDVDSKLPKCALSREDGSIEIRDPNSDWVIDRIIPGQDGTTVEHLSWCNGRLFSAGLNGEIIEWSFESLQPKYRQDSYGGPVWCLRFNYSRNVLAAGCEDGSIRIFEVLDSGIMYQRCLHKQKHRILSLAWSHDDTVLASGGFDCTLRVYDVKTGYMTSHMTTSNLKKKNTMIWSIEMLKDMTLVTGDSHGNTQFWDSNTGTLLQSFHSHTGDVLAVAVCNNDHTIYSTGVDSKVVQFCLVQGKVYPKWVQTKSVRATNHDTRALAICTKPYNCVISGGIDPRFVVYPLDDFSSQSFVRYSCLPPRNVCQLAPVGNILCFREQHKIHAWKLGNACNSDLVKTKKLFEVSSDDSDHLICSAISDCGKYLAYSSVARMRVLEMNYEKVPFALNKIPVNVGPASVMTFTKDAKFLLTVGWQKAIKVINMISCTETDIVIADTLNVSLPFCHAVVSSDNMFCCLVDSSSSCFIFELTDGGHYKTVVPKVDGIIVSCSFHPQTGHLFIATSSKNVYEFDIALDKFVPWLFQVNENYPFSDLGRVKDKIQAVVFNPKSVTEMFVQNKEVFCKLQYGCDVPQKDINDDDAKPMKRKKASKINEVVKVNNSFSNIMYFDFNAQGEIVIVERLVADILQKLPAPLKVKKFGS